MTPFERCASRPVHAAFYSVHRAFARRRIHNARCHAAIAAPHPRTTRTQLSLGTTLLLHARDLVKPLHAQRARVCALIHACIRLAISAVHCRGVPPCPDHAGRGKDATLSSLALGMWGWKSGMLWDVFLCILPLEPFCHLPGKTRPSWHG